MAELKVDISKLPKEVREILAELDLELSEDFVYLRWEHKRRDKDDVIPTICG